jgi:hypothetical protein
MPSGGPFGDPILDEGRAHAVLAVVGAGTELPAELVAYLIILEKRHCDLIRQQRDEVRNFLGGFRR